MERFIIEDANIPVLDGYCMQTNDVRCSFYNTDKSDKASLKLKTAYMMFLGKEALTHNFIDFQKTILISLHMNSN